MQNSLFHKIFITISYRNPDMNTKIIMVTIGTWFLFMILAIINAGIRNGVYKPIIGDLRAHQLSTLIFIILILIATYIIFRFTQISLTTNETIYIGVLWMIMTICFEFLAGHYIFGNSWDKLFTDYDLFNGRVWMFVPISLILTPYFINKIL